SPSGRTLRFVRSEPRGKFMAEGMVLSGIIVALIVGAIAGWLAGLIVEGVGFGLLGNIVVGIVGALIASFLLPAIGVNLGDGIIASLLAAVIGAVVLRVITGLVRRAACRPFLPGPSRQSAPRAPSRGASFRRPGPPLPPRCLPQSSQRSRIM